MQIVSQYLYKSTDGSSLAVHRILFGLLMMVDIIQERGGSRIDLIWGNSQDCHFPLFPAMGPLNLQYMCRIYGLMWICAFAITVGLFFHVTSLLFTIAYWYLVLLDKSYWNNHTYLYGLLAILLSVSSASNCWSIDAILHKGSCHQYSVPNWNYFLLRFQLFILYFYAGLKKVDWEWLNGYSMKYLGDHWLFDPFRYFLTFEQVDYFLIHLSGFLIDISGGFLLIFNRTRPLGFLLLVPFHLMNTKLFNIGVFPYVCLATLPIFCAENWPRKLLKPFNNSSSNNTGLNKTHQSKICTTILIILYCFVQLFLPWSHFITKGFNNWTPGLYGYSWDMMVHRWDTALTVVRVVDHNSNEEYHLDPKAWTLNERWSKHADMCLQYAQCIKRNVVIEDGENKFQTSDNISIYIDVWCSLNGRFQQRMFDPNYDLLQAQWSPFEEVGWLKPLLTDSNDWRTRIADIESEVHSWSNYSDVMVIADFPGLEFVNFISSDLSNITLTVLNGAVYYAVDDDDLPGWHLKAGHIKTDIKTNSFHRISTVGAAPSCFMYTYYNNTKEIVRNQVELNKEDIWASSSSHFSYAGTIHPTGHIDGITPYIVLRLAGSNDARNDGAHVDTHPDPEVIERVLIHDGQLFADAQRIVRHCFDVTMVPHVARCRRQTFESYLISL